MGDSSASFFFLVNRYSGAGVDLASWKHGHSEGVSGVYDR